MVKPRDNRAWLLVLPVVALVAFSALIPVMTVVNYSVQDSFGNNEFFWNGTGWFKELLDPSTDLGGRFFDALWRTLLFSALCLLIEVPLGIGVALSMPRRGWGVAVSLVVLALPLLTAVFNMLGILGGWAVGVLLIGIDSGAFWGQMQGGVDAWKDVGNGVVKSVVFGFTVTFVALLQGYAARPTPEGVARATTRTVVASSLAVLGLDFILTAWMFSL